MLWVKEEKEQRNGRGCKHAPAQNFLLCDKYRLFIFNDLSDLEMILPKSVSQNESSYAAGTQQSAWSQHVCV